MVRRPGVGRAGEGWLEGLADGSGFRAAKSRSESTENRYRAIQKDKLRVDVTRPTDEALWT